MAESPYPDLEAALAPPEPALAAQQYQHVPIFAEPVAQPQVVPAQVAPSVDAAAVPPEEVQAPPQQAPAAAPPTPQQEAEQAKADAQLQEFLRTHPGYGQEGVPTAVRPDAVDYEERRPVVLNQLAENTNRRVANIEGGVAQQEQAAREQAQIDKELADARQPLFDKAAVIAQESATAIKTFNDAFKKRTQDNLDQLKELSDKIYAERNYNPADVWGNSSTGQKAGSLLGVIAAGLSGQGALRYVDHLVNQAVALQKNRLNTYRAGTIAANNLLAQSTSILKSEHAGEQMYRSQLYDGLIRQGEALKNKFASKQAQANLDKTLGELALRRDALEGEAMKEHYIYELQGLRGMLNPLQQEKLRAQIGQIATSTEAKRQSMQFAEKKEGEKDLQKETGHVDGPLEAKQKDKVAPDLASTASLLLNLNGFEDSVKTLETNPSLENIKTFIGEAQGRNPVSFVEARIKSKTGAAINQVEYDKNIAPFLADTKRLLAGEILDKAGLRNYLLEVQAARRALTRSSRENLKTWAPNRDIPLNDPAFGRSMREIVGEQKGQSAQEKRAAFQQTKAVQ